MIPEEAVEAAAGNYWDNSYTTDLLWIDAVATRGHDDETAQVRDMMRAALEAAAPHMLAGAWEEGAQAGFDSTAEGFNGECVFDHCAPDGYPPTNPYSGEKWEVADWEPTP